jgi:hypothetical protein
MRAAICESAFDQEPRTSSWAAPPAAARGWKHKIRRSRRQRGKGGDRPSTMATDRSVGGSMPSSCGGSTGSGET